MQESELVDDYLETLPSSSGFNQPEFDLDEANDQILD
jgi:hypothetical protein